MYHSYPERIARGGAGRGAQRQLQVNAAKVVGRGRGVAHVVWRVRADPCKERLVICKAGGHAARDWPPSSAAHLESQFETVSPERSFRTGVRPPQDEEIVPAEGLPGSVPCMQQVAHGRFLLSRTRCARSRRSWAQSPQQRRPTWSAHILN